MSKIILIDYYGNCDASGKSIGHSPKVLAEYAKLLKEEYQVEAVLAKCIAEEADSSLFDRVQILPYQIVEEGSRNLGKRIWDKVKLFRNVSRALRITDEAVLWFYRTDFFLFLYFLLHRKPSNKKLLCLVYQQKFAEGKIGRVLNYIYKKGLQKFDGVIYTQKNMHPEHPRTLYIPDYYYDSEMYDKYSEIKKEKKVVCLGTMSPYKKLEELVDAFKSNGISLEIRGKFYDKDRVERLKQIAGDNIVIENAILPQDEYYRKMAGAQYTVLPYDMGQYTGRTSGVLLEALFMKTIAIAPSTLLSENGMAGIGYESLGELSKAEYIEEKGKVISALLEQRLQEYPTRKEIKKELLDFIGGL